MAQLTTEELQQIKDMQAQYNKHVFELGSIEAQLFQLNQTQYKIESDKDLVLEDIKKLGVKESEVVAALQAKYGTGSISIEDGTITPA